MKKILFRLVLLAIVAAAGWAGYRWFQQMPQRQVQIPTTKVKKGDVVVRSYTRGELRAVRSATLTAPNLFGTVQVTRLAPLGSFAREKDLVVEFDDSEVLSRLEEKELELEQIDEQIKKAKADLAMRHNQDQVDLLRARYSVRRAELEVKRNELISQIDAKKNVLNLEEARRRLQQLEVNIKGQLEQAEAELARRVEQARSLEESIAPARQPSEEGGLRAGDIVWIPSLQSTGRIIELLPGGEMAEVQVGSFRTRLSTTRLELRERAAPTPVAATTRPTIARTLAPSPGIEIDLRGQTVEETLPRLEKYLDDAYLAGLPWVRIIHGKGTGALRRAVQERLKDHALIAKAVTAPPKEGGEGVTIIYLASQL